MSVLVVGVSHKTAPMALLDQLALDADGVTKLLADAQAGDHVTESTVVATCNRLEIYAVVDRFHGSVEELSRLLLERADEPAESLLPHLYVHYDDGAVSHLFQVASGLDSMALGEGQILGQTRDALRLGQEAGTVGPVLNSLFQQALRVGKRAHAETDIDRAAPSLVTAALEAAAETTPVAGARVLVLGAGSMASLAVAALTGVGAGAGRGGQPHAGARRPARHGVRRPHRAAGDAGRGASAADLVIACTGSADLMVTPRMLPARPLTLVDLALPHDIDPAVGALPGVRLVNLALLGERLHCHDRGAGGRGRARDRRPGGRGVPRRPDGRPASPRPWSPSAPWRPAWWRPSSTVSTPGCPGSRPPPATRWPRRWGGWPTSCCTSRPSGSRSWPTQAGAVSYAAALAELFSLDPEAVEAMTRPVVAEESPRGEEV